ncbi:hypothetical protein B0H66DRAFT_606054 [Apodospora peruviana]|uniref:Cofilin n=1 Tax=Apodospora peruviana TaxID=516989 RepID=A0AAE0HYS9_9PEZI|nr:hypothetical protein B0H66DRAFT_606054 [Apodospora peruviana]
MREEASQVVETGQDVDVGWGRGTAHDVIVACTEFENQALTERLCLDRATVSQECIQAYNDLKLNKKYKYVIYKLSDDNKEIVVDSTGEDDDYDGFREKLINAKTKSKTGAVGKGPRYAVYDFEYQLASGEGTRNKITFIAWSPDDAGIMAKMVYASSKEALKRALTGIATELQANDADDIEYESIIKTVSKGTAA